jgi:hypothetical protein
MLRKSLCLMAVSLLAVCVTGCSAKKVVARNCEKAGNAEVYVCDPL